MAGVFIKDTHTGKRHTGRRGEDHIKTQAEAGVL